MNLKQRQYVDGLNVVFAVQSSQSNGKIKKILLTSFKRETSGIKVALLGWPRDNSALLGRFRINSALLRRSRTYSALLGQSRTISVLLGWT